MYKLRSMVEETMKMGAEVQQSSVVVGSTEKRMLVDVEGGELVVTGRHA